MLSKKPSTALRLACFGCPCSTFYSPCYSHSPCCSQHHLTEYPVPRGRGPAPERPYLNFFDLIEKYSPRLPGPGLYFCWSHTHLLLTLKVEEYVQPEPSYRMESESPTISIRTPRLKVHPSHHASLSTPSPSSSYAPMPRTPVSPDGSLFPAESGCAYVGGVSPQDAYLGQPGS